MIRLRLWLSLISLPPILFYLIWGFGLQGIDLIKSLNLVIITWLCIIGIESYLSKSHAPHLTSLLIGLPVGYGLGQTLIYCLQHLSTTSPILEKFPFEPLIYTLSIYGIIHLFIHLSTFTHKIYLVQTQEVKGNYSLLKYLRFTTYSLIFGLILLLSLHLLGEYGANNQWGLPPDTISAINNSGYDFDLPTKNPVGKHSLLWLLGISFVLLVEFILKRRLIPILIVLLPSSIFACIGYRFTEHFFLWISFPSWLPSDLIQTYTLILWLYLGLMWSFQCYRQKTYKLLFWEIHLED